jgi:hypothetical protein
MTPPPAITSQKSAECPEGAPPRRFQNLPRCSPRSVGETEEPPGGGPPSIYGRNLPETAHRQCQPSMQLPLRAPPSHYPQLDSGLDST